MTTPHFKTYLIIVLSLALFPIILPIINSVSLPTNILKPVSSPSYINLDNDKDEYLITGQVAGFATFPSSHLIFLHLYKKQSYTLLGISFSKFNHFAEVSLSPSGNFSHSVPSGEYKLSPLTLPQHHIYFSSSYPLAIAHHNPPPINVSLPHTSFISYIKSFLEFN